jgi:hypothetical protein
MARLNKCVEKCKDVFLFREGSEIDNIIVPPTVTTGSIIWGILLRSAIIIVLTTFIVMYLEQREFWWFALFAFWLGVALPAYRQWTKFHERVDTLKEDTLCGKCRYFVSESQLCALLDDHIGIGTIPCDGESWEANPEIFYK